MIIGVIQLSSRDWRWNRGWYRGWINHWWNVLTRPASPSFQKRYGMRTNRLINLICPGNRFRCWYSSAKFEGKSNLHQYLLRILIHHYSIGSKICPFKDRTLDFEECSKLILICLTFFPGLTQIIPKTFKESKDMLFNLILSQELLVEIIRNELNQNNSKRLRDFLVQNLTMIGDLLKIF